jgi:hypothetical protein
MKQQPEYYLQKCVCEFLRLQYPKVLFLSDSIASNKLTIPQQVRNKAIQKAGFSCPDLLILQPNNTYKGLFIELKVSTPFKKDGGLKASAKNHLINQWNTIQDLNQLGYFACFSWGLEMTINIINLYMKNEIQLKKPIVTTIIQKDK